MQPSKEGRREQAGGQSLAFPPQPVRTCGSLCGPRPSPCASPVLPFLPLWEEKKLRPTALLPCDRAVSTSRGLLRLLRLARRPPSSERSVSAHTPLLCLLVPFMKRLRHHVLMCLCPVVGSRGSRTRQQRRARGREKAGEDRGRDLSAKLRACCREGSDQQLLERFAGQRFGQREANGPASAPKGADENGVVG